MQRFHLHHAIAPGPREGLDEHARRHLAAEGEQFAQEAMPLDARRLEGEIHVGRHLGAQAAQPLFLVLGTVLAMLGQVRGGGCPSGLKWAFLTPSAGSRYSATQVRCR